MPRLDEPDAPDACTAPVVAVTVTRSGGFAGLRRRWSVERGADDADAWLALIAECPWDDAASVRPPRGADMFVWSIRARGATAEGRIRHDAELQDPQVSGAWRDLIDAVRAASGGAASSA